MCERIVCSALLHPVWCVNVGVCKDKQLEGR